MIEDLFDQRDLYAVFQAALSSSDRSVLEAGVRAWRTCASYVLIGFSDIDSWLTTVMPDGLSRSEWDRRARYGRAKAKRCAGFAMQPSALAEAEAMERRAIDAGSTALGLWQAIRARAAASDAAATAQATAAIASASCEAIRQYTPASPYGVRWIGLAMRESAAARADHVLNSASQPARSLGINLAYCDLDPVGCGIDSNFVGSACMQSGKCGYTNEIDYWKGETPADVWSAAQPLREQLVAAINRRDCEALFR